MQQMSARPNLSPEPDADRGTAAPAPGLPPPPPVGVSPQKLFDTAQADYFSGQYDLAILGWTDYIKTFPKSPLADDAQVNICAAYVQDAKYDKAVDACDVAIRTYPDGDKIAEAYYRKGVALSQLRDINGARTAWEQAAKLDPDGAIGRLAKQGLDRLRR